MLRKTQKEKRDQNSKDQTGPDLPRMGRGLKREADARRDGEAKEQTHGSEKDLERAGRFFRPTLDARAVMNTGKSFQDSGRLITAVFTANLQVEDLPGTAQDKKDQHGREKTSHVKMKASEILRIEFHEAIITDPAGADNAQLDQTDQFEDGEKKDHGEDTPEPERREITGPKPGTQ